MLIKRYGIGVRMILALAPVLTALLCLRIGRYSFNLMDICKLLWTYAVSGRDGIEPQAYSVLFNIRLPRIILATLCGAGLAVSGAAFQPLFSNVLATPDTLGVAQGACFGAALALLFYDGLLWVQLIALVFGLVAIFMTYTISKVKGQSSTLMIILAGIAVSSMFTSFVSLVKYVADPESQLPTITYWLLGSMSGITYQSLMIGGPLIVVGTVLIYLLRWRLNVLSLSEDEARSLGVNLKRLRILIIFAASMITASCASMCGRIEWVGLLVPHTVRILFGSNNEKVIPASISLGAVFMLIMDTVARAATTAEIPLSILTAVIGAPVFIVLLRKSGGKWL